MPEPDVGLGALSGVRVVLVGTGTHASDLPDVPAVAATLNDLRQALIDRCGIAGTAITVVPDPESIEEFGTPITDAAEQAEDLLLIYYVGHGLLADDGTLHLATMKSPSVGQRIRVTSLPYATVRACVADSPARSRVVILDCCYSGIVMPALGSTGPQVADLARIAGAFVLTATGRHELALAPPGDRHTAFTGALLRLLEAGDPDLPELLTLEDVFRHLDRALPPANLPGPRRMADGTVASLVVARNPGVRIEPPEQRPASRPGTAKITAGECPYKGLAAFDTTDERWFFGRSELVNSAVRRLAACVADAQPLVVLGASGAGKSSLLRAGVLPALARGELGVPGSAWWPRRVFTPMADPVGELARQLTDLTDTPDGLADLIRSGPERLPELLRTPGRDRVVLVVDQFEELFAPDVPPLDRKAFIRALTAAASAATGTPAAVVVLGVRADFFGQCAELPELTAALDNRPLMVRAMTRDQTREAITAPAARAGRTVDPGLVEVLLTDLGSEPSESGDGPPDVEDQSRDDEPGAYEPGRLPLLSHALRMTWYEQDDGTLSVEAYRRTGGIHRALAATADQVLRELSPAGQACARLLFLRLVHIAEDTTPTRRRVPRERLLADLPDPVLGADVLDAFAGREARLVTADKHTVEITHEALIRGWPALRGWIDQDRAGLVTEQHLIDDARDWEAGGNDVALLYRGSRLGTALTWADEADHRRQLPLVAQRFLTESERQETRRKRVRTGLVIALSVMLVVALGGLVAARAATVRAQAGERAAVAEQLRLQANALLAEDPAMALRLAVVAHTVSPGDASRLSETVSKSRLLGVMPHPNSKLVAAEFTPNGRILVTAGDDNVTLWRTTDPTRPVVAARLTDIADFQYPASISSLAISPDGHTLAVAGGSGVQLWDIGDPANPRLIETILGRDVLATEDQEAAEVNDVAFGRGGRWLVALMSNGQANIWSLADPTHPVPVVSLDMHPQGFRLDPEDTTYEFVGVASSNDGRALAVTGSKNDENGTPFLVVWNVSRLSRAERIRVEGEPQGVGLALAFSPDGRTLASGGPDDKGRLWRLTARNVKPFATLTGHGSSVQGVAFSPDGNMLATAGSGESAVLWDVSEPDRPLRTAVLETRSGPVNAVAFSPDGQTVVTVGEESAYGTAMLWTVAEPDQVSLSAPLEGHTDALSGVAFSSDGRTVATGSWDHTARLWDTRRRKSIATLTGHTSDVFTVAFSPDGKTLATGSRDKTTMLWRVADRSRAAVLPSGDVVPAVAFSPNGDTLAVGSWLGLELWNVADPASLRRVGTTKGDGLAFGVAFSPDGGHLATTHTGGTTILWRVSDPAHPVSGGRLGGHKAEVNAVAFSRKGNLLATSARDNTMRLWNVANPDDPSPAATVEHHNHVLEVAFSPDGKTLATASVDRTVDLWNVVNPKRPVRIATLRGHTAEVSGVAFSPDGRTLASSSYDKTARLWDVARHVEINSDPVGYACAVTHGGLTEEQWAEYVPELDYQRTCP